MAERLEPEDDGRGTYAGRGPRGYRRSDARVREDVCDRLTDEPAVDASELEVVVRDGEVTLSGSVASRGEKYRAEDVAGSVSGVEHVNNLVRVRRERASVGGVLELGATTRGADIQRPFGAGRRHGFEDAA